MNLFDFAQDEYQESCDSLNGGYKLIFFDTETTGASKDDQIIEIGAIVEDSDGNTKQYEELCGTLDNKLIEVDAMVTHGIRNEDIEGLEPFTKSSFYKDLDELNISSNYLIAHNLPFDKARLEYYGFKCKAKLIDTLQCAKHLFEVGEELGEFEYPLPNYKLQTFRYILFTKKDEELESKKFNVSLNAHRAIGDVVVLRMFFNKLLERLDNALSFEDKLEQLVALSKEPVKVKKFNFGKYKGKLIVEVFEQDRGYLEWLFRDMTKQKNSGDSIDENMYNTLKELVG